MSKTAEDILKELDAVEKMSDDLGDVVAASEEATKVAEEAAARPVAAPAPKPAVPPAAPVVPGLKLNLSELLKPAYKPEFSMAAAPASAEAPARPEEARAVPPVPAVAPVAEVAQRPELTSGNRPGVSVLPATGKILENLSGSLDLLMIGVHASIQRAGIHEQDDQLGILSMVVANMKKVQNQVDGILGRI